MKTNMKKEMTFINMTNHRASAWSDVQTNAALQYGSEIVDIGFPMVPSTATSAEIRSLADEYVEKIKSLDPACVLCQGEMTLVYNVVTALKKAGIPVVSACSERKSTEKVVDGKTVKTNVFEFVQFREY